MFERENFAAVPCAALPERQLSSTPHLKAVPLGNRIYKTDFALIAFFVPLGTTANVGNATEGKSRTALPDDW